MPYLCTVFFMVLDLRLSKKIGLSRDNPLFLYNKVLKVDKDFKDFSFGYSPFYCGSTVRYKNPA